MHSITYSSIGDGEFTKELLDANFAAIGEYTVKTANYLSSVNAQTVMLRAEVQELAKQIAKKQNSSLTPFVVGTIAGVVLYRAALRNRRKLQEFADKQKDETIKTTSERV